MNKLVRKKINKKDLLYILQNLRDEDKEEIKLSFGEDYIKNELKSIMKTKALLAVDSVTGKPILVYGITPLQNKKSALIFMLSTNDIVNYKHSFFIELKKEIKKIDNNYYYLCNIIYKKNFLAKKWLKKFGFKFDISNLSVLNVPDNFEFFYRIRENNVKGLI